MRCPWTPTAVSGHGDSYTFTVQISRWLALETVSACGESHSRRVIPNYSLPQTEDYHPLVFM